MKNLLVAVFIIIFLLITSCSKNQNKELIGVWQRTDSNVKFNYKLVFGKENTGLSIYSTFEKSGKIASSVTSFVWSVNDNVLEIYESETTTPSKVYNIDFEKKIVSKPSENIFFEKKSNEYSKYY